VYNNNVRQFGQNGADTQSARPGYSEHQTGLAVDLGSTNRTCEIADCFAGTREGEWLAANAHTYGFVLRYSLHAEKTVGYKYEPWHFRFVGRELANEIHKRDNEPLETFFGLPAASDYN